MNQYKNINTRENYDRLLSSGMFWEFHPELSGDWERDKAVVLGEKFKLTPLSPRLRQTNVISCFSQHHSYYVIPVKCKGKRMAFQKGWEAKKQGLTTKNCPYEPKIKNQQPTNPYHNYWHLGYECCQNSL